MTEAAADATAGAVALALLARVTDATAGAVTLALLVRVTAGVPAPSALPREHESAALAAHKSVESVPILTAMRPSLPQAKGEH